MRVKVRENGREKSEDVEVTPCLFSASSGFPQFCSDDSTEMFIFWYTGANGEIFSGQLIN